jgi:MFS family permease
MVSEGGERKTFALVLLCCASFVAVLDLTIVAIALPSMRRELGISGGDAQWILTGYALSFGGLLLLMGHAGDLYGRRRLFVSGLALFAAASLLGGLAWAPWVLVAARLLQGLVERRSYRPRSRWWRPPLPRARSGIALWACTARWLGLGSSSGWCWGV